MKKELNTKARMAVAAQATRQRRIHARRWRPPYLTGGEQKPKRL